MRLRRRTIFIGLGAFMLLLGMAGYAVLHFTLRVQGDDKGLLANLSRAHSRRRRRRFRSVMSRAC